MSKTLFLFILLNSVRHVSFSQDQPLIDSLEMELKNLRSHNQSLQRNSPVMADTPAADILHQLSRAYLARDPEKAMAYARQNLDLSTQIGFKRGMGNANNTMGSIKMNKGEYIQAMDFYKIALQDFGEAGYKRGIALCYNNIGLVYYRQSDYPEALKNYLVALKLVEELGDRQSIAMYHDNIGSLYLTQASYVEAIKHHSASLKIGEELGDKRIIESAYNNIGVAYENEGNYPAALENLLFSLKYSRETGETKRVADSYGALAYFYLITGNYNETIANSMAAIKIHEKNGDKPGIAHAYMVMGQAYTKLKEYHRASGYLENALVLSKELGDPEKIEYSYKWLAVLDSSQGNYEQALKNYKMGGVMHDSVYNEENEKRIVQMQMQYEFDKKEASVKAVQDEKDAVTSAEINNQKIIRNFSFALALLILAGSVYFFYRYKKKKQVQSRQALMNERLRISAELHDEVGATLSGIAMYSHLTKEQMKEGQTDEIEKSLNVMQQSSAQMVDKLNDIVWLINPEQDSLEMLLERLEEYAREMAAIKNMQVKIKVPDKIADIHLPVANRRNIYLFCKEAINNAVKYSHGTALILTVKETAGKLEFAVSDNGKGFDAVVVRRGNGLENMQKRADEMGAKLSLQSKENEGTSVSLEFKIT